MTRLSVNLNKIALLRNSRGGNYPNVLAFAERTLKLGAGGITIHPRQDQRHARYADVRDLSALLKDWPEAELNIEGCPVPEFLEVVHEVQPDQCTLVPDTPDQVTSDHGWNIKADGERIAPIVRDLQSSGIRVSLFVDPDPGQIRRVPDLGADRVELYTETYATAYHTDQRDVVLDGFRRSAEIARSLGLGVNAGHDLNLENLAEFLCIPEILEVSIGHAITVESFEYGWDKTVCRYLEIVARTAG